MDHPGRASLLLLLAMTPLGIALLPLASVGLFAVWALVGAALLMARHDPALRRGVAPALACLGLLVPLGLAAAGVTVGVWGSAVLSFGGDTGPLAMVLFLIPVWPGAVLLTLGPPGSVRGLARASVVAGAVALVMAVWAFTRSVANGDQREAASFAVLAMSLAYALGLAALALGLRARWPRARASAAEDAPQPQA